MKTAANEPATIAPVTPPAAQPPKPIATPGIAKKAVKERIYKGKKFSDHAPLIVEYDYQL